MLPPSVIGHGNGAVKPDHLIGSFRNFSESDIFWVASQFGIAPIASITPFAERGNINLQTYLVECVEGREYLLQRINTDVFKQPYRVMNAMQEWIKAQSEYIASGKAPTWTIWEPITLVQTTSQESFLDISDSTGWSVWRMMIKIADSVSYKSLSAIEDLDKRAALAEEVGRGLALSADLTSRMKIDGLVSSLPGYRDTKGYYNQFHSVVASNTSLDDCKDLLPTDSEVRESTQELYVLAISQEEAKDRLNDPEIQPFIQLIQEEERNALTLFRALEEGTIRNTAIHGDTKIENFLFARESGQVRCLVDLDTIMPFTWLADWGDMMRSLCNVAGEKEANTDLIRVDQSVYDNVTRGFLQTAKEVTEAEVELMADAVQIITLELGVRFLTDYLRGDNYFMLGPGDEPDLNKVRGIAQLTLFQRLKECDAWTRACVLGHYNAAK